MMRMRAISLTSLNLVPLWHVLCCLSTLSPEIFTGSLFSGVANPREPLDPLTQFLQLAQRGLRVAAPVKQRVEVLHDLAEFPERGQATGDGHTPLALGGSQATGDEQKPLLEQGVDLLLYRRAFTREAAR